MTPEPTAPSGKPKTPSRIPRAGVAQAQPSPHERYVREVVDTLNALDAAQAIIDLLAGPNGELSEDCPRQDLEAAAKTAVVGRGAIALRERACDLIEEIGIYAINSDGPVASAWLEVTDMSVGAIATCLLLPPDPEGIFYTDSVSIALKRSGSETRVIYSLTQDGSLVVRVWSDGAGIEAVAKSHCLTAYLDELFADYAGDMVLKE